MASSFKGWGTSWAQTWDRISNPNAMYGSVTIRFTATGVASGPFISGPPGSMSGSASISFTAVGSLSATGQPQEPTQSGGSARRGTAWLKQKRRRSPDTELANYNLTRLHQDDQVVTELLVALVTKGFFDGNG